jgi:hypothetical protein
MSKHNQIHHGRPMRVQIRDTKAPPAAWRQGTGPGSRSRDERLSSAHNGLGLDMGCNAQVAPTMGRAYCAIDMSTGAQATTMTAPSSPVVHHHEHLVAAPLIPNPLVNPAGWIHPSTAVYASPVGPSQANPTRHLTTMPLASGILTDTGRHGTAVTQQPWVVNCHRVCRSHRFRFPHTKAPIAVTSDFRCVPRRFRSPPDLSKSKPPSSARTPPSRKLNRATSPPFLHTHQC